MQTRQARRTPYLCPFSSSGPLRPVDEIETGNIGEEGGHRASPVNLGAESQE